MSAKILVVDDEATVLRNLNEFMSEMKYNCETAKDGLEALKRLRSKAFDMVLADIRMPGLDGLSLLKQIKAHRPEVDVIMMTGYGMEFSYVDVIQAGASDFIVKPFRLDELLAKIQRVSRERDLRSELLHLSMHDGLTDLFNRRHFFQKLEEEVKRAQRQKHALSFAMLDVDHFKEYNDTYGHLQGDHLLVTLSKILCSSIRRDIDCACRYGGDEFGVLLIETSVAQACRVAERIRKSFLAKSIGNCTLSIGVAQINSQEDPEDLIRRADDAMYEAKRAGGNQVKSLHWRAGIGIHQVLEVPQQRLSVIKQPKSMLSYAWRTFSEFPLLYS